MECHKCQWNDRRPSKAKTAACSHCVLPPDRVNHKGKTFVSMDSGRTAEKVAKEKSDAPHRSALDGVLPKCCQETAARLLGFLEALGDSDRNLVMRILRGKTHADVARELGVTRQAVSGRWAAVVRRHPELRALRRKGAKRVL
jgi:hypothetical protein